MWFIRSIHLHSLIKSWLLTWLLTLDAMKTLLPFLLGITLLIQACSPEPVYRLQAQTNDETTFYYQGKEYIHLSQDSIDVIISYFEHTSSMFAVDVEIINNSDRIIRISPDSFSYKS